MAARLLRRSRWPFVAAVAPAGIGVFCLLLAVVFGEGGLAIPAIPMAVMSLLGIVTTLRSDTGYDELVGEITGTREGLYRDGNLVVSRHDIAAGLVSPGKIDAPMLRLVRKRTGPAVCVRTSSVEEAQALLEALELDASRAKATLSLASQATTWPARQTAAVALFTCGLSAMFLLMGLTGGAPALAAASIGAFLSIVAALAVVFAAPTRVHIGSDGVLVRWLGTTEFHAYDEIESVGTYAEDSGKFYVGVTLVLRVGRVVRLCCGQQGYSSLEPKEIASRIEQALARHRAGEPAAWDARLARGNLDRAAWIQSLRELGNNANVDWRTAPAPDTAELLAVAEDVRVAPETRAAAAIAALPDLGDEARIRIRRAADTSASPRLRVAFEKIASDTPDDAAIEEAVAALEAESAAAAWRARH